MKHLLTTVKAMFGLLSLCALVVLSLPVDTYAGIDVNGLVTHALEFSGDQLTATASSIGTTQYPGYTDTSYSSWNLTDSSGWTSGFFPGCLWFMYESTGDSSFLSWAQTWTTGLENEQYNTGTHDTGHMILCSYGNGYRQLGDPDYKAVILQTAESYATRFDPDVGCIRSWDFGSWQFPVIIDNMITLELLFWAAKNGGDPNFYDMALSHAYKTLQDNVNVRNDGSTYHVVDYNPTTGAVIGYDTSQGMSVDSCWSRGQAWGLHGFTIVYRETGDPNMLDAAVLLSDYFVDNLPADGIPYSDFDDPSGSKDSSAAAIAAAGLLELSTLVNDPNLQLKYYNAAENTLISLCTKYSDGGYLAEDAGGNPLSPATLMRASRAYGESELSAIFGDYYLIEVLLRYKTTEPPAPAAPKITSAPVTTATVGQLYTYDVDTIAYPRPTYTLTTYPSGMTIDHNTGLIEWTPTDADDFDVIVKAGNGEIPDDNQSFTITVESAPIVMLDDGFEGATWDANWVSPHNWLGDTGTYASGTASAHADGSNCGDFVCFALDAGDATAIHMDFWFMKSNTSAGNFELYYYDGTGYNLIADLDALGSDDVWLHYTDVITESAYFIPDFQIRFNAVLTGTGPPKHVWVDDVLIQKAIATECDAANLDGIAPVNFGDFAILANDWLLGGSGLAGDIDGDEVVDLEDLNQIAKYWLSDCGQ